MKLKNLFQGAVMSTLITLGSAVSAATLSEAGKVELARYSNDAVSRGAVPGVVTVVLDRRGVLYENASGKRDVAGKSELYPNAIFRIASMTKPITTVATLMLVEEGKDRKSTRLNSSHVSESRMPSSA